MRFVRLLAIMFVLCSLLVPAAAYAAKKYQVTGTVIEIGDKVIVVEKKDGEKWEIDRTADTKVEGDLKKGAKVTIYYTMSASEIDVKK